jgi:hypothetical protein
MLRIPSPYNGKGKSIHERLLRTTWGNGGRRRQHRNGKRQDMPGGTANNMTET